jgi:hypothetical protein
MSPQQTDQDQPIAQTAGGALQALGFHTEAIAALRQNGTITSERRGRNTVIFKLRYRLAARQHVKYLGTYQRLVEQIHTELGDLQAARRRSRRLRRLDGEARALLRAAKLQLEAPLEQAGLKFHGRAIRRLRNRSDVVSDVLKKKTSSS